MNGFKVDLDQLMPEASFRIQRGMDKKLLHQLFIVAGCSPEETYDSLLVFDRVTEETLKALPDATCLELVRHANKDDCATNPRRHVRLALPDLSWGKGDQ